MLYVASRVARASQWRELRASGVPIVSSWIDEAGEGQTTDLSELWTRIVGEILVCDALLFYGDVTDAPWKGALVEVGAALALRKPVFVVTPKGVVMPPTYQPIGSWVAHPLVTCYMNVDLAVRAYRLIIKE